MSGVKVGDKAPDFALPSQSGDIVHLSDYAGRKNVVLYFYPKDFTTGCTAEAKAFKERYEDFRDSNTEVIGVSADSVETHQRFTRQCSLPFKLLSDAGRQARELYGVTSTLGIPGRVSFVIDKDGIVRNVFSSQLRPTKHIKEALATLKSVQTAPKTT